MNECMHLLSLRQVNEQGVDIFSVLAELTGKLHKFSAGSKESYHNLLPLQFFMQCKLPVTRVSTYSEIIKQLVTLSHNEIIRQLVISPHSEIIKQLVILLSRLTENVITKKHLAYLSALYRSRKMKESLLNFREQRLGRWL